MNVQENINRTNENNAQVERIEAEWKIRELFNAVSRYLICSPAGKCFQRILIKFVKESLIMFRNFDFCAEVERVVVVPDIR